MQHEHFVVYIFQFLGDGRLEISEFWFAYSTSTSIHQIQMLIAT